MEFKIGAKTYEIKFSYNALFKANKEYSEVSDKGESMNNGAANLFTRLISNDDTVLFDILKIFADKKTSDEKLIDAVDDLTKDGDDIEAVHADLVAELKESGFFLRAIKAYEKTLNNGLEMLKGKEQTEDTENSIMVVQQQLTLLQENL